MLNFLLTPQNSETAANNKRAPTPSAVFSRKHKQTMVAKLSPYLSCCIEPARTTLQGMVGTRLMQRVVRARRCRVQSLE